MQSASVSSPTPSTDYLEPLGYELDCARNGRTGLEMAASGQFDLVVLDIMMPRMDGYQFTQELRSVNAELPILMALRPLI